jgi:SNF2 family DNA or RNA helicase
MNNNHTRKVSYYRKPDDMSTDEWQIALRQQFAEKQNFTVKNIGQHKVYSDFLVFNPKSGNEYKIAVRDYAFGNNFCECPDFKKNGLGTCKHIEFVLKQIKDKPENDSFWNETWLPAYSSITLKYGEERKVVLRIGTNNKLEIQKFAVKYFDKNFVLKQENYFEFGYLIEQLKKLDPEMKVYPDAFSFIIEERDKFLRRDKINDIFKEGAESETFKSIIKADLYPYQKEGILKTLYAGRAIIADEMGLGKTLQAIAASEVLKTHFKINKVLIICPTSLKYQWQSEIQKFTDSSILVVEGQNDKRVEQYYNEEFYHIVSYGVGLNDVKYINEADYDLVILDEAQRIKNWKTKTAQNLKNIESHYAIVLTGTPLENKLDELHSLVEFINPFRLGALFRFLDKHQLVEPETNRVYGYKDLSKIKVVLDDLLIRRTKKEIINQLPKRIDKTYFVELTDVQKDYHNDYETTASRLASKWKRFGFLNETDRQRLLMALACQRMVSDSTYILDQKTRHDTKIGELMILLNDIFENSDDKVVIFSQWERMTRLVARELEKIDMSYEYLHGGVHGTKRKQLLDNFKQDKATRVFLSTDAGGVGLNLQSANIIINLDLPWNPAVLEQRIARVHRLGQQKVVNVINFVSKGSIEHRMLSVLKFKKSLFEGVLDGGEDQLIMEENRFSSFMHSLEDINNVTLDYGTDESREDKEVENFMQQSIPFDEPTTTSNAKTTSETNGKAGDDLQDIFSAGAALFGKIGQTFTKIQNGEIQLADYVKTDDSGKTSLNIPIENKEVITSTIQNLSTMLGAIAGLLNQK